MQQAIIDAVDRSITALVALFSGVMKEGVMLAVLKGPVEGCWPPSPPTCNACPG